MRCGPYLVMLALLLGAGPALAQDSPGIMPMPKQTDAKPVKKHVKHKAVAAKPAEAKPAETKPAEAKAVAPKPAAVKPRRARRPAQQRRPRRKRPPPRPNRRLRWSREFRRTSA